MPTLKSLFCAFFLSASSHAWAQAPPSSYVGNATSVYEVTLPLPDYGSPCASMVVLDQEFSESYGHPVNIDYSPPANCPDFTHVTVELDLASYGYQYDRLMHLIMNGVEVWRPSTPEPVGRNITSTQTKDLSTFVNIFNKPGQLQFDLDNAIASGINGPYYAEMTLKFYRAADAHTVSDDIWFYTSPPTNADAVIAYDASAAASPVGGTIQQVSRNTTRAVMNVFASGNADEEFWYTNTLQQGGPTRMVEVYIDGQLVGITDPFAVVFTGGIDPGLWSPLLGIRASDVPSYAFDVTPFLPGLWNHSAQLTVAIGNGYNATEAIQSNWIINAALLTWEEPGVQGSGTNFQHSYNGSGTPSYDAQSGNTSVEYTHEVWTSADLNFVDVQTNASYSGTATWTQSTHMSNKLNNTSNGTSTIDQFGEGSARFDWASKNGSTVSYTRSHHYPLALLESNSHVNFNRTWDVEVNSNGVHFSVTDQQEANTGTGGRVTVDDIWSGSYHRHAEAVQGEVTTDQVLSS